ncbi:MAG: tetratricopeptide repeat protein [Deltaproteobacteria bacterium]|nr:tetratricopeptide repeat protein [Deltaproteobacteria bacterium]MDH3384242.1 tetratricopeptide repeat protein [Deltaproteobacteria bacterium]
MARKIKYTRKDLKSPDEFISTLGRVTLWIKENRVTVIAALVVVFLALGGIFGTRAYFQWQETKASRDLWPHLNQAREYLQNPADADSEKLAQLEQFLAAQVNKHPGTRAAVFAKYYLGSIAYLRKDYDRSAAQFRSAIADGKDQRTVMDFLLREGLAQALEAKGETESAEKAYGEAASFANGELRTQAWMGQARLLALQGRKDEAAAVFRKILAENPDTPFKDLIEIKLSHLG